MADYEKMVSEIKQKLEAAEQERKTAETALAELKTKTETTEAELKTANDNLAKMEKAVNGLGAKLQVMEEAKGGEEKRETLAEALEAVFGSDEFKTAAKSSFKNMEKDYELKVATSDVVAPIHLTHPLGGQIFPTLRQPTLLGRLASRGIPAKGKIGWLSGSHTTGVGYVGEGTNTTTSDGIVVIEKSRAMAKISAHMKVTTEMTEDDAGLIAGQLQTQLTDKAKLFADAEMFDGDGDDTTQPNHFYGLKGVSIAFDADKAGVTALVPTPTIADVVDAMVLQGDVIDAADATLKDAGGHSCDWVFMHPSLVYLLQRTKDKNGQFIINKMLDGSLVMGHLTVIKTKRIAAKAIMVADSSVVEFYVKRNLELKVAQIDKDALNDMFTLILFFRAQMLVRNDNNRGVIYCADYNTAITDIEKP